MTQVSSEGCSRCPVRRLQDIFQIYEIDDCSLVKMDIEGHEAVVLPTAGTVSGQPRNSLVRVDA